ncbi:cyanoexosortase B [Cyanobacterium stanieri LEGE 03274]|uniref:Cyanoexosortase B n=1 Tax=Cyanobacterium stanieri LEGE 03274 TaxID=1828756 RepID=A0ABR9V205_9CHRO|nr:cyanoexosortase B [Cyanobacterium stanieri]MBE9221920.1 cyanoexosortase B [Cyanobacterium stanieri LEGE 03274]
MALIKSKQTYLNLNEEKIFYIILGFLCLMYFPLMWHWYDGWLNKTISIEHEYFSHGVIGIPFAFYLCWLDRKKWHQLPNQYRPQGFFPITIASIFYLSGVPELVNLSFPIILLGICYFLKGKAGLKLLWFPFILIILATPNSIPYLITPYTLWLQRLIATLSGFLLFHLGFDVSVNGIYISVNGRLVEVAPYCAGLKMLFTSLYISLILLYWRGVLGDRTRSLLLLVGAVFISVIGNVFRNTILAFFHGARQDSLFVWFHDSWGGEVYSTGMLICIFGLLLWIEKINFYSNSEPKLNQLTTNDEDDFNFNF